MLNLSNFILPSFKSLYGVAAPPPQQLGAGAAVM
jgi:hypothetical protein